MSDYSGPERRTASRRGNCSHCPLGADGHCIAHDANMLTLNDLKQTRMTAKTVGLILLGILVPIAITLISYGASLSKQVAVLDSGWRENRGRIERIEAKVDLIVDKVHEAIDNHR